MVKLVLAILIVLPSVVPACDGAGAQAANYGLRLVSAEDYGGAVLSFKKAIELDPACPEYRVMLAAAFEHQGDRESAARELGRYLDYSRKLRQIDDNVIKEVESAIGLLNGVRPLAAEHNREEDLMCLSGRKSYSAPEALFSFMQISDIHIGEARLTGYHPIEHLNWIVDTAYPVIKPKFIVATGDLTNSSDGAIIPLFGPHRQEWEAYARAVAPLPRGAYHDIPGNHDHYNDKKFEYFRTYSVSKNPQSEWKLEAGGRMYQFVALNTAAKDSLPWPFDNTGLDNEELAWLESVLSPQAAHIFIFGHHSPKILYYGGARFRAILERTGASYFYGHNHLSNLSVENGRFLANVDSLGCDDENNYILTTVLGDGDICVKFQNVGTLP